MQSKPLKYCQPLAQAAYNGLQKRFADMLELKNTVEVNEAIIASTCHPFFKLRWIELARSFPPDELSTRVKSLLTSAASELSANEDKENSFLDASDNDDYFGFSKNGSSSSNCPTTDLTVLKFLDDSERSITMLHRHKLINGWKYGNG